jgi:hypothetical protein
VASTEHAVAAAVAVAREHGLPTEDPRIVRDLTNVIVHLAPALVVARVALALADRGVEWLAQQVELVSFLAAAGAPVAPPTRDVDPGPHERNGLWVTLWTWFDHDRARLDANEVGRTLRELHDAMAGYGGNLPTCDRLGESTQVLQALVPSEHASAEELEELLALAGRLEPLDGRPIHGDAHFGNVLCTRDGHLWTDFENMCAGPVEYDLAALAYRAAPATADALAAYGDYDAAALERVAPQMTVLLAALTVKMALMGRLAKTPEPRARVERALAYAREM